MQSSISYEDRKKIFDTLKLLVSTEQEEVYKIIRKYKETYTENYNGIFFDLNTISDEAFIKIKEYIDFCLDNRHNHEARLKELDNLRKESLNAS